MKFIKVIFTTMMVMVTSTAMARALPFGSGSTTGNYYAMLEDIFSPDWCGETSTGDALVNVSSEGSIANMQGMMNKLYYGGICSRGRTEVPSSYEPYEG